MILYPIKNKFRIPLIVFTPKSLLRHPKVMSPISELESGNFQEVIDDSVVKPTAVKRVILCTGKVYYDLLAYREEHKIKDVALVRLEQLYPLSQKALAGIQKRYSSVKDWVWVQEEPNQVSFLKEHFLIIKLI